MLNPISSKLEISNTKLNVIAMTKDILYSIGQTSSGQLIKAVDAEKGDSYVCPSCNQEFVLRKGTRKRPHFAHKALSPNCTPETALHYEFKILMFKRIQESITQKSPLELQWKCSDCGGQHRGNLLKKATLVKLEHDLGTCKPDIALIDEYGSKVAVIEVIVSHVPEQSTLDYYSSKNIAVVSYKLNSDEDINRIDIPVLEPDSVVNVCRNPKCLKCGKHQSKKCLLIIDGNCWKCKAKMKVAALRGDVGYEGDFTNSDIQLAIQNGVFMKWQYSRTAGRRYIASTCRKCNKFVGHHYLFDYVAVLEYERLEIDAGYYCPNCSGDD